MEIETQSKKNPKRPKGAGRDRAKRSIANPPTLEEPQKFLSKSNWIVMPQDTSSPVEPPDRKMGAYLEFANKGAPDVIGGDVYGGATGYFRGQGEGKLTAAEWRQPRGECVLKLAIIMARFNKIIDDFGGIEFDFYDFGIDKIKKL